MRKYFLTVFFLAVCTTPFFYNCSPSSFSANKTAFNASENATVGLACGSNLSGTRWWDLDNQTQTYTCPTGATIQVRYLVEKRCDNGITTVTGQRVVDTSGPTCPAACQSQTQKWTVAEGNLQQTVSCSNGQAFNNIYQRLVEYSCVNNAAVATGNVITGALVSGQSCSTPGVACGNDSSGNARTEGAVWQERINDATTTMACPNNATGNVTVRCEQYLEFQCVSGLKQLTTRQLVTLNCNPTNNCSTSPLACSTESGGRLNQETWTSRIYPDFIEPGVCTSGGDLMISSERLQTYQCNNGVVVPQQVVRGQPVSQSGQCAPLSCLVTNGSGRQSWVLDSTEPGAGGHWGVCSATSCETGFEIYNGLCVVPCPAGESHNPVGVCQVQVCINPGDTQSCYLPGGARGTQACDTTRTQWGPCQ